MADSALEYNIVYSLEDIQAIDPGADLDDDNEFGPILSAVAGSVEYTFYPEDTGWALQYTWRRFALRRKDEIFPLTRRRYAARQQGGKEKE